MDEVIVRVLRTVACQARLRLLAHLLGTREATPSQLAQALGMRLDLVSAHLARLTGAGLIMRRRSGLRCFCIARSPYRDTAFSGQVLAWLRDALPAPSRKGQCPRGAGGTREAHAAPPARSSRHGVPRSDRVYQPPSSPDPASVSRWRALRRCDTFARSLAGNRGSTRPGKGIAYLNNYAITLPHGARDRRRRPCPDTRTSC